MRRILAGAIAGAAMLGVTLGAQMPDVSQMSGMPLPTGDLPDGAIAVRVVRGDLSNNVVGQAVELHGGGQVWRGVTDAEGRATFTAAPAGTSVHALATVDGVRLESQEFAVPQAGGVRVVLVAGGTAAPPSGGPAMGDGAAAAPAAPSGPAVPGTVAFGSQSRFIVEVNDEALDFYVLLEVVNATQAPVEPDPPLVFTAAEGGGEVSVLEGSSPQASAAGRTVTVAGPMAPGRTLVQFAYRVPYESSRVLIRQELPAAMSATLAMVRKVGNVGFASPQLTSRRETVLDGQTYYVANGPNIPAGGAFELELTNLPVHSTVPRTIALVLALLVVAIGVWASTGNVEALRERDRRVLEAQREQLFARLLALDQKHEAGGVTEPRYSAQRLDLLAALEGVYEQLDDAAAVPPGAAGPHDAPAVDAALRTRRA